MAILTAQQILQAEDLVTERVHVPQWGGDVFIRTMCGRERDAFEASTEQSLGGNIDNVRARLVALCAVDESGKRLFRDSDVLRLGQKSAAALDRLFAVAMRLNGLTPGDMAELTKNSGGALGDNSNSSSPSPLG